MKIPGLDRAIKQMGQTAKAEKLAQMILAHNEREVQSGNEVLRDAVAVKVATLVALAFDIPAKYDQDEDIEDTISKLRAALYALKNEQRARPSLPVVQCEATSEAAMREAWEIWDANDYTREALVDRIARALDRRAAAERERCASIADNYAEHHRICVNLAAAIRGAP